MSGIFDRWRLLGRTNQHGAAKEAEEEICRSVERAQDGPGILGWIHVDSFGSGRVPAEFDFLDGFHLPAPGFQTPDVFLRGADAVLRLLDRGATPYYESLAQVDLYVQGRNEYRDPVEDWQPLIEATEVPAGRVYKSPVPIQGLSLPHGEKPFIDLIIRVHRRGEEVLGEFRAEQNRPQEDAVPVQIEAQLRPGHGSASFVVESEPRGLFHAEVRESRVAERDQVPSILYSWPPGSAWVVPHDELSSLTIGEIERLSDRAKEYELDAEDLKIVRETMNKWLSPHKLDVRVEDLDFPAFIEKQFVYLGPNPCSGSAEGSLDRALVEYADILEQEYLGAQNHDWRWRDAILFAASWLYEYCPQQIVDGVRRSLQVGVNPREAELAVAGHCFRSRNDYLLFFDAFAKYIAHVGRPSTYWLRAYRNIARFRADALRIEHLSVPRQLVILRWYLSCLSEALSNARGTSIGYCARLAPHILKRRRYDPSFLEADSKYRVRLVDLIDQALAKDLKPVHRDDMLAAMEFLNNEGTTATLERLGRNN